jgi:hypothetical protein
MPSKHWRQAIAMAQRWWARQDSNLQPDRYERPALTIELRARAASFSPIAPRLSRPASAPIIG